MNEKYKSELWKMDRQHLIECASKAMEDGKKRKKLKQDPESIAQRREKRKELRERKKINENSLPSYSHSLSIDNYWEIYERVIKDYTPAMVEWYKEHGSDEKTLKIVTEENKRYGSVIEKIVLAIKLIGNRENSEHDGIKKNKKIEIKSSRYWSQSYNCRWQHIEQDHDYDCVLFVLLHFDGSLKIWGIEKSVLFGELRQKNILTKQGKEGWWCDKENVIEYCKEIKTVDDLDSFLQSF